MLESKDRNLMYNTVIFSFGQSGSGKTHTLIGSQIKSNGTRDEEGIALLSLESLQNHKKSMEKIRDIQMYAIQVYRGVIYDALVDNDKPIIIKAVEHNDESFKGLKHTIGNTLLVKKFNPNDLQIGKKKVLTPSELEKENAGKIFYETKHENPNIKKNELQNTIRKRKDLNDEAKQARINAIQEAFRGDGSCTDEEKDKYAMHPVSALEFESMKETTFDPKMYTEEQTVEQFKNELQKHTKIQLYGDDNKDIKNNFEEALKIVNNNRPTRSTRLNPESSRSHLFLILEIHLKSNDNPIYLTFSDLAGMENPSTYTGMAMKEGLYITETLKKQKDFSQILSLYAQGKNISWNDLHVQLFGSKINHPGWPIELDYDGYSKAVFNIMNFVIGGFKHDPSKSPTKILTFINVPGYLIDPNQTDAMNAAMENTRTCEAVAQTLTFGESISGGYYTESSGSNFGRIRKLSSLRSKRIQMKKNSRKKATRESSVAKKSTRKKVTRKKVTRKKVTVKRF